MVGSPSGNVSFKRFLKISADTNFQTNCASPSALQQKSRHLSEEYINNYC